jgi:hypothetical protein
MNSTRAGVQVNLPMSKALTIAGMVVAGLVGAAFALDLAVGIPFDAARPMMDVGGLIAAAVLGYLAWDALRDVR